MIINKHVRSLFFKFHHNFNFPNQKKFYFFLILQFSLWLTHLPALLYHCITFSLHSIAECEQANVGIKTKFQDLCLGVGAPKSRQGMSMRMQF
ncbi:hypothetical protein CDL12_16435 [Handroanthus impetiginosus]|uniref:Uncharacterized protein n=1 Tax=Handroanthus impetiginosus TaxID=429701 RepID=A0A2G9H0C1_9LAMI|nr:hypothetical protein CDL12_16435 [Handroanthus impetiginosus]